MSQHLPVSSSVITQSLCERVKGICKSVAKLRSLTAIVGPIIISSSLRSVPLQNVSARVKCSQCCCGGDSKVNTAEGGDAQHVILKELQGKEEEWF